jgi:hypothetical protein
MQNGSIERDNVQLSNENNLIYGNTLNERPSVSLENKFSKYKNEVKIKSSEVARISHHAGHALIHVQSEYHLKL